MSSQLDLHRGTHGDCRVEGELQGRGLELDAQIKGGKREKEGDPSDGAEERSSQWIL